MHLTDQLHPSSLFKYVSLRQAQAVKPENISTNVGTTVYSGIPSSTVSANQSSSNLLYPQIAARKGTNNAQAGITSDVTTYKTKPQYAATADALQTAFPELSKMINYMDGYGNAVTEQGIINKFSSWAGMSLDAYATNDAYNVKKMVIWDNILAHIISPVKSLPITLLCKMISALNVIDFIHAALHTSPPTELSSKAVYNAYHIQPLIPDWIIGVMLANPMNADASINAVDYVAPNPQADLNNKVNLSSLAASELKAILDSKLNEAHINQRRISGLINQVLQQNQPSSQQNQQIQDILNSQSPPESEAAISVLNSSDVARLSDTSRNYLTDKYQTLENLDINTLIDGELNFTVQLMAQLGMVANNPSIYLADTLIGEDEHKCQHYDNNPDCVDGRQATKPFVSAGSFVNAMIVGDLLVTRQQIIKYDVGEVAHIENIMEGESKTRTHRNLERTEVTTTTETETENETTRDTQTTERFSMEKESSKVIATDFNINAGINATASYGTVNVSAYMNGGYSSSTQESNQSASQYSKDVTNRTLNRVKTMVREMKTVQILKETEETNVHTLANQTNAHINGVYRWVDKYYLNRIINYGKRLMLEFQIPEPANFYVFRNIQHKLADEAVVKPLAPLDCMCTYFPGGLSRSQVTTGLTSADVITDTNYTFWAAYYGAEVEAPPLFYLNFSKSFKSNSVDDSSNILDNFNTDIAIPDDTYQVTSVEYQGIGEFIGGSFYCHRGMISDVYCNFAGGGIVFFPYSSDWESKTIGLSVDSAAQSWILNLKFRCMRTQTSFKAWQLKTYAKIMDAYNAKLDAYNQWLSNQMANEVVIDGDNPDINRETERTELKKRCIEMFSGQRFESNDAAVDGIFNLSGYPEILFNEAIKEGNIAKFFEHAFEWENMTYIFYDYFYGRKKKWLTLTKLDDKSDPLFKKFLQAGNARVNVPVRPGYEKLVMLFHALSNWISSIGCAWNFDPQIFGQFNLSTEFSPGIENGTYMSIADELKAAASLNDYGTFTTDPITGVVTTNIIDAYIQKVPTNLVYMTNGVGPYTDLPDFTGDQEIQDVMTHFGL